MSHFLRYLLPGLASGFLVVLALPKPDLHFLAWVALVPLLLTSATAPSLRTAALAGYGTGLTYFGGTCYWIADTMILYGGLSPIAAAAVTLLFVVVFALHFAAFSAVLCGLTGRLYSRGGNLRAAMEFPAVCGAMWVVVELVRTHVPFGGFPWMLVGYAAVPYPALLQTSAWTGVYGLSFFVVAVNGVFAQGILRANVKLLAAGALAVTILWVLPAPADETPEKPVEVRLVQPNLAFAQRWDSGNFDRIVGRLSELSAMPATAGNVPRLIVWPETPGPFYFDEDPGFRAQMERIAVYNRAYFVFGYIGSAGDAPTNSAAQLHPLGSVQSRYDKIHLVPFGEYVPARRALFFAEGLLEAVGGFAAGTEYSVAAVDGEKASTIICYESIFPGLVRQFVSRGAGLIVLITNDGWFGDSSAPYQHLRMGIVRAVENGRWVVRAANSGVSAIIDPRGRVHESTRLNEQAAVSGTAGFRSDLTFYTRYGDLFAYLNVGVVIAAAVWRYRRNRDVRRVD